MEQLHVPPGDAATQRKGDGLIRCHHEQGADWASEKVWDYVAPHHSNTYETFNRKSEGWKEPVFPGGSAGKESACHSGDLG